MRGRTAAVARVLVVDLLGSVAWFPVWWYTIGLNRVAQALWGSLRYRVRAYGFGIWFRNFFVPMYGQYDLTGRLISVFMRTVIVIARSIALVLESIVYVLGLLLYLVAPPLLLTLIILNVAVAMRVTLI